MPLNSTDGMAMMIEDFTDLSVNMENAEVLNYLQDLSAHSDIVESLVGAVAPLGDVKTFCPDITNFAYVVVSTNNTAFGFAAGQSMIAFQLDTLFKTRSLQTGGSEISKLRTNWVSFELFRTNWPAVDLQFWARKAYLIARGEDPV